MKLTRRQVLAGAAASAIGATGIYELVDRFSGKTPLRAATAQRGPEQHLLDGIRLVHDEGIPVLVPPLHHEVVTAHVAVDRADLRDAQAAFEHILAKLDEDYAPTPAGLGVTVAWGLPYFRGFVGPAAALHLPYDKRARKPALLTSLRFPSDTWDTVLETNHVAILLRSDTRAHIDDALRRIQASGVLRLTSFRRGFAGGGFDGGESLPKQMAMAAGVPGADLIPRNAELFLGFTSTQKAGMGPGKIANFETLGLVDLRDSGYFRHGTHMHLSHVSEDLEAWYINFDFRERAETAFRPNVKLREYAQTVDQGPKQVSTVSDVEREFKASGRIGHSAAIQTTSRLTHPVVGPDGTKYEKGAAIPIRADFNTLDNAFAWSVQADEVSNTPVAGIHFVVFNPSSDDFHRNRLAMDGVLPGTKIEFAPGSRGQGFNAVLTTTHRQNFLVPPRAHRSFPLAEL